MPNNNVQTIIKDLIINHGRNIVKKDRAIQGYIEDTLSAYPAQKNISINLAKEGILKELSNKSTLSETELKSYTNQIVNRYGTDSHLTQKTIEAWAEALGIKLSKIQQKKQMQSQSQISSNKILSSTIKKQNKIQNQKNNINSNITPIKDNEYIINRIMILPISTAIAGFGLYVLMGAFFKNFYIYYFSDNPLLLQITFLITSFIISMIFYTKMKNHIKFELFDFEEGLFFNILAIIIILIISIIFSYKLLFDTKEFSNYITKSIYKSTALNMKNRDFTYKLSLNENMMFIISLHGKTLHILSYPPNNKMINVRNLFDVAKKSNLFTMIKDKKLKNILLSLKDVNIIKKNDVSFYAYNKKYTFTHIALEFRDPISKEELYNAMNQLGVFLFNDKHFVFDDKMYFPVNSKYLFDFTNGGNFYLKHNGITIKMFNKELIIYANKDNIDKNILLKITNFLNKRDDVTLKERKNNILTYDVSKVKDKKSFFENIYDSFRSININIDI